LVFDTAVWLVMAYRCRRNTCCCRPTETTLALQPAPAAYHIGLMNRGVFVAPRGMWAVSAVTTEADVKRFVDASAELFRVRTGSGDP